MPRYSPFKYNIKKAKTGDRYEDQFAFPTGFLTGYSAKCQVRTEYGGTVALEMSSGNGRITISGDVLTMTCPANEFTLEPGNYVYDIQIFTSVADVATVIEGEFEVTDQITK
ncbi:MAG TPA: hypothetical protein PLD32_12555 [Saprospiraceae bacterium]|nr:hypothetical protein [Saprospiraceae bacterium]HNG70100.1 hypothetical protein [Saprospiraceae bacterium]